MMEVARWGVYAKPTPRGGEYDAAVKYIAARPDLWHVLEWPAKGEK